MEMDPEILRKRLINAARINTPSDKVPYGFARRVMSSLPKSKALDVWNLWSRILWKAAAPCVAVTLLISAWSFYYVESTQYEIFGVDLEETMFSALEINGEF